MKQNNEEGRSLLEILAVLVIMTVLVMGGIYLWQVVQEDNEVNVITQRIVAMRTERQANISSRTNQTGSNVREEKSVIRGAQLTMENGRGERNKDYFWIIVSKINSSLCVALSQADQENLQTIKITPEDSNVCKKDPEVTFYFPKYENATGDPDRGHQPADCPAHYWGEKCNKPCPTVGVKSCDTDGLVCEAGYYRDGDKCEKCSGARKYSNSGSITCRNCPAGQKANADHTGCDDCGQGDSCDCPNGQTADGAGGCECPEHSLENVRSGMQITGTQCYCVNGYKLNSAKTACVNCAQGDNCGCPNGQKWDGGKCAAPVSSCSAYPNSSTTVRSGLQITGTQCYCVSGYKLNSAQTACITCAQGDTCGCPNGQMWDGEKCSICPAGYSADANGDPLPNYPGCYCPSNTPYFVSFAYSGKGACYSSKICKSDSDCPNGYYCVKYPIADTCEVDDEAVNRLCSKVTGSKSLGNGYYTATEITVLEKLAGSSGATHTEPGGAGNLVTESASQICENMGKELASYTERCTASEISAATLHGGVQKVFHCAGWSFLPKPDSLNGQYLFKDTEYLSGKRLRFYTASAGMIDGYCGPDGNYYRPLCRDKTIDCSSYPNSSATVREGQQIGTTGCYCNEGYKLNENSTACVEACPEGSSFLNTTDVPNGRSPVPQQEGCYCNSETPYYDLEKNICTATPNCVAAVIAAGLPHGEYINRGTHTVIDYTIDYTVSGNTITLTTPDSSPTISKDLNFAGCDLVLDMPDNTVYIEGNIFANSLNVKTSLRTYSNDPYEKTPKISIAGDLTIDGSVDSNAQVEIGGNVNLKGGEGFIQCGNSNVHISGHVSGNGEISVFGSGAQPSSAVINVDSYVNVTGDVVSVTSGSYITSGDGISLVEAVGDITANTFGNSITSKNGNVTLNGCTNGSCELNESSVINVPNGNLTMTASEAVYLYGTVTVGGDMTLRTPFAQMGGTFKVGGDVTINGKMSVLPPQIEGKRTSGDVQICGSLFAGEKISMSHGGSLSVGNNISTPVYWTKCSKAGYAN